MEILSLYLLKSEQFFIAIIGFILLMSIVVFIHEFGHYYVARLCGVKVEDFSIGFGKKIFSYIDKKETKWSLSLIPLGGYVRFFGDRSETSEEDAKLLNALPESEKKQTFYFKPVWQKMLIVFAGPFANFILSFILLASINFFIGIVKIKPVIHEVNANSVAEKNGLQSGDVFTHVNDQKIDTVDDVKKAISASFGEVLTFKVLREKQPISLSFPPDMVSIADEQPRPIIGVTFSNNKDNIEFFKYDIFYAFGKGFKDTFFVAEITGKFLKRIFLGKESIDNLSGPIKIGDAAGTALQTGFWQFILLMALISMSIGLINLLPVPMLDGGHLFFYMFEAVGLKFNPTIREFAFKLGFLIIIFVMVFTICNDIISIGR